MNAAPFSAHQSYQQPRSARITKLGSIVPFPGLSLIPVQAQTKLEIDRIHNARVKGKVTNSGLNESPRLEFLGLQVSASVKRDSRANFQEVGNESEAQRIALTLDGHVADADLEIENFLGRPIENKRLILETRVFE